MAYADKLVQPFQKLHNGTEFNGIGIGLATIQSFRQRHGGKVWAKSMVSEGATLYFALN